MGSFVVRFLTNSPGLGEDFFSQFWVNSPRGGGKSCGDLFTQSGDLVGSTYRHQESAYSPLSSNISKDELQTPKTNEVIMFCIEGDEFAA